MSLKTRLTLDGPLKFGGTPAITDLSRFSLTTYPAVRLSCCALTLLCLILRRTPAVPLIFFTLTLL